MQRLTAGEHLVAAYADNFMSKSKYKLKAVPMLAGTEEVDAIRDVEGRIRARKADLAAFEREFNDAKRRFLDAKERYALEEMELKEDLAMRGFSYGRLFGHEVAPPKRGKKKEGCAQQ